MQISSTHRNVCVVLNLAAGSTLCSSFTNSYVSTAKMKQC